jgi:hypothetical protein
MSLEYENLIPALLERVPELSDGYDELVRQYGGEDPPVGAHIVFGILVTPLIMESLAQGVEHGDFLTRLFQLLEEMAVARDDEVKNVVVVSVLERLGRDPTALLAARALMGDATQSLADEVEGWSRRKRRRGKLGEGA